MKRKDNRHLFNLLVAFSFTMIIILTPSCSNTKSASSQSEKADMQATAEYKEERTGLPVVSILVDLPTETVYSPDALTKTLSRMLGYGKDFSLLVEALPSSGQERDIAASRIRTEIMAGKGPDLFLCAQRMRGLSSGPDPFFKFPVKAMSNHIFMPLDNYIEKAEDIDWDSFQPVVMDAGRNKEGQQIIPLAYTFEVALFDRSYTPQAQFPMTWEQMTEDPDPNIRVATQGLIYNVIGDLADYAKDVPAFSEEELLSWVAKQYETWQTIPTDSRDAKCYMLDRQLLSSPNTDISLSGEQEYTMIPVYNMSGGVTANITTFAAVNRNARHPDEAFRIIEYLLDPEVQQTSSLFQDRMEGLPVYTGTGNADTPQNSYWQMNEVNYKAITAVQEQINVANFPGPLEACLWEVLWFDEDARKKSVHEQYVLMEMLLAES